MNKYSGVVLDFFDDQGATLRAKFPTADELPDVIKTAGITPAEELPEEAFALVALDGGDVLRKYACHDPGTTALSVIYFMEHGDKLPETAMKTAASNLANACVRFGMLPPAGLSKMAETLLPGPMEPVDLVGQVPLTKVKTAMPTDDADFMWVDPDDGSRRFPINTPERIKLAEQYLQLNGLRMRPEVRRSCSVKLAAKAESSGIEIDEAIKIAGATTFGPAEQLARGIASRRSFVEDSSFLDELQEKTAELDPGTYAEVLRRFDAQAGLDNLYDSMIPDPWESTFGIDKTAEVVWEDGADRVTAEELRNLANNAPRAVTQVFTDGMQQEFIKDPIGIFNSMPKPQKRILARMAVDSASYGGSEMGASL